MIYRWISVVLIAFYMVFCDFPILSIIEIVTLIVAVALLYYDPLIGVMLILALLLEKSEMLELFGHLPGHHSQSEEIEYSKYANVGDYHTSDQVDEEVDEESECLVSL